MQQATTKGKYRYKKTFIIKHLQVLTPNRKLNSNQCVTRDSHLTIQEHDVAERECEEIVDMTNKWIAE